MDIEAQREYFEQGEAYMKRQGVKPLLASLMATLATERPEDPVDFLIRHLKHTKPTLASDARDAAERKEDVETTYAFIKPDAVRAGKAEEILDRIRAEGFTVVARRKVLLSQEQAKKFYAEHVGRSFFPQLLAFMTSGPAVALALRRTNAIKEWRKLCGPTNALVAKQEAPNSLRALYGSGPTENATHGSDSTESAVRELSLMFPDRDWTIKFVDDVETTYAFIKPDAVRAGKTDEIMDRIRAEGFDIVACRKVTVDEALAKQFYAEHVGRSFFPQLLAFMTSGPAIAMALRRRNAIKEWRKLCGPINTEVARKEAPNSLRALYGSGPTENATHGSDSTESAQRELSLMFPDIDWTQQQPAVYTTYAFIKPDAYGAGHAEAILRIAKDAGFEVAARREVRVSEELADQFYAEHVGKGFYPQLKAFMTSGPALALALRRVDAIKQWRKLIGPTNSFVAQKDAPDSIRGLFGTDQTKNAVHGSDAVATADRELRLMFPNQAASLVNNK
eukprot:TRINITY_DN64856_c2_g4_i1.p1 TRINITY_DN64856_c2_g4~~TRINITY_DN64856_c2_g4_i1.p1  ORF type:complete len:506 (+),score=266.24 TRINITY_DN64856_c2_g4_i1:57-1574(+)